MATALKAPSHDGVSPSQTSTDRLPPMFCSPTTTQPLLVSQGAEALLYRSTYLLPTLSCALKYRPRKSYRHPTLDARLTRSRILAEARILLKCRKEGVPVPGLLSLDDAQGWLMMEWIDGLVSRVAINQWLAEAKLHNITADDPSVDTSRLGPLLDLLRRIGKAVGSLHAVGVIHGDLTTSNLMLRIRQDQAASSTESMHQLHGDVVLIDFGLASQSQADEDRAVDLYVLERAFGSTHPSAEGHFQTVLNAYGTSFKGAQGVLKKLEDVRLRGRKRSMLG